jgi:hypothetical protein
VSARLIFVLGFAVVGLLAMLHLRKNDPETDGTFLPPCSFHEVTGLHCPGCGGTRAGHALANFRIGDALKKNALLVVLLPFLVVGIALEGFAWVKGPDYRGPRVRLPGGLSWWFPGVIVGFWILRNVPMWPFDLLAPR